MLKRIYLYAIRLVVLSIASKTSLLSLISMAESDSRTKKKKDEGDVLYRGVHAGHPDYQNALKGRAVPWYKWRRQ